MIRNCSINDEGNINGMKTIFMENDLLKIGILAGRGSDIFQFEYKLQVNSLHFSELILK